jgi:hypothetical protein
MEREEGNSGMYRLDEPLDLLATLDQAGIEHVEVSAERTIIIYNRTIFNCEVDEGRLHEAQRILLEVFDQSPDLPSSTDSSELVENLVNEIGTTAGVHWE